MRDLSLGDNFPSGPRLPHGVEVFELDAGICGCGVPITFSVLAVAVYAATSPMRVWAVGDTGDNLPDGSGSTLSGF